MSSRQRYKAETVATALTRSNGLVGPTAAALGCDRGTVYNYIKRYAVVRAARDAARETIKDVLEAEWLQLVRDRQAFGHWDAVKFGLRTFAKDRGFVERAEISGPNGGPIETRNLLDQRTIEALEDFATFKRGDGNGHVEVESGNGSSPG